MRQMGVIGKWMERAADGARWTATVVASFGVVSAAQSASAQSDGEGYGIGQSAPGQLDIQEPVTQVARQAADLHHFMLWIVAAICVFVLGLLAVVIVRYNRAANPNAASWTHNTLVEVIWTAVPVLILVVIAIPSVRLLQLQEDFTQVEPDIVIKATGRQWYWDYEYVGEGVEYSSFMIGLGDAELTDDVRAQLADYGYHESAFRQATDTMMVVPVGATVLVQSTGGDVIHSFSVPALWVKADGVPGRLNLIWFNAEREGIYFGYCQELCGRGHSFMPIVVNVVDQETYDAWIDCAREASLVEDCEVPTMLDYMERNGQLEAIATADGGEAVLLAADD